MKLWIAEKPKAGAAFAAFLGIKKKFPTHIETDNGTVTWCIGHLMEIPSPDFFLDKKNGKYIPLETSKPGGKKGKKSSGRPWSFDTLPIVPDRWEMVVAKEKSRQFNVVKGLVKKASEIVHAGDADREGQRIVDEILEHCNYKGKVSRLWVSALNDASLKVYLSKSAIASLPDNKGYKGISSSAQARARADWLFGMNMTRAFTLKKRKDGGSGLVTVGRVQTPTLKIVVDHQEAIDKFKPEDYFVPSVKVSHLLGEFNALGISLSTPGDFGSSREIKLSSKMEADAIIADVKSNSEGEIVFCSKEKKSQRAPLPCSLSFLQQQASSRFGITADKTLEAAQTLYETHKAISYPRSNCRYLPTSFFGESKDILSSLNFLYKDIDISVFSGKSKAFDDSKQTAHTAIIPTGDMSSYGKFTDIQHKIFSIVCEHYVAQFMPEYVYAQSRVIASFGGNLFFASGNVPISSGWKNAFFGTKMESEKKAKDTALPAVKNGDRVKAEHAEVLSKRTEPPKMLDDGALLRRMIEIHRLVKDPVAAKILKSCEGIGEESTRSSIIKNLKDKGFINEVKKGKFTYLKPSETGKSLISSLPKNLVSPLTTAAWEGRIKEVEDGNISCEDFVSSLCKEVIYPICDKIKSGKDIA